MMEKPEAETADPDVNGDRVIPRSGVRIDPNGEEYLVTINGSVFVALSRRQAEAIASRTRRQPRSSPYGS